MRLSRTIVNHGENSGFYLKVIRCSLKGLKQRRHLIGFTFHEDNQLL